MLQWFIRFPKLAEFIELLFLVNPVNTNEFHLGKTPMFSKSM